MKHSKNISEQQVPTAEKARQELIQLFESSDICENKTEQIKKLLQVADLDLTDLEDKIDWGVCLSSLVIWNCSEIVFMLVPHLSVKQIFAQDKQRYTSLMHAVMGNQIDLVKLFLHAGPTLSHLLIQDRWGSTALMYATMNGYIDIVKLLLEIGRPSEQIAIQDNFGKTALMHAALYEHIDVVKFLLDSRMTGDQINLKNNIGFTALMDASYAGNLEMVELLLPHLSAEHILTENDEGHSAIDLAAQQNHGEALSCLLKALHEKTCNETLLPILRTIAESDNADMLLHLICSSVTDEQLNLKDEEGWNPLMIAAAHGATDVMKILIKRYDKDHINASTIDAQTALMYAIQTGICESVKMLLDAGASPNCTDIVNDTPLRMAALWGKEMVQLLLDAGLSYDDISCHNYRGTTALMNAAESGDQETVRLLLDAGLTFDDIARKDADGQSALDYAENEKVKTLIAVRLNELSNNLET